MTSQFLKDIVTGAAITESLAPKAPKVPSPFDFADPDRRQEKFAITRFTDPSSYTGTNFSTSSSGDGSGYGSFVGNLDVTKMQGDVAANFGTINKPLSYAMGMQGMAPFISAGGAISKFNLERIYNKVQAGEGGHGIAMLGGNIVAVSPGLFGGYTLSGMLPEGLTSKQRQQIIDNILNTNAVTPDSLPPGSPLPDDNDDPVFDDDGYSGVGPSPDDGGSMGDPGYYPSDPPPAASPPPYTGRPDDSQTGGEDSDNDIGSGYDSATDNDMSGGPGAAKGGRVGLKGGGAAGKAPSTGFIDGPPQNYSKGMTVADTEDMKVRVGSFVINAPTTERLQKEGKLPKGPQKRKAAKGGKMMDVSLSKGEYLIDVADIEKFGGYDALNAENDKGKAEVDRRQAAASGGFINGYKYGGTPFTGPQQEPDLTMQDVRQVPQQNNSKGFVSKPLNAAELRESDFNQLSEDLLFVLEGDGSKAYFPGNKRSGVTVGKGFDIGQHSVRDMQKMGFSKKLINKFKPYAELKGNAAKNILKEKELILLPEEVEEVDRIVLPYKREKFLKDYPQYSELNPSDKSVMFSAHYVGGLGRYESFQKVFNKTNNMEKALKTGLIKILPKGAAERNRAEKALKWWKSRQGPKITLDSSATYGSVSSSRIVSS